MDCSTPGSLREEHDRLREGLAGAIAAGGATAEAARAVRALLEPHMRREEAFALPPLSLLEPLALGVLSPAMVDAAIGKTEILRLELANLREEHVVIAAALTDLVDAARREGRPEAIAWAEAVLRHEREEDEFLYPAAILVGEYLKARMPFREELGVG